MSKQSSSVILIGLFTIVLAMTGAAVLLLRATGISVVAGLPMLAVGVVIVLVILLCLLAVVFAAFDLQNRTQALALPEGLIRAVIALMLIVLFAIPSIYLYGSLSTSQLVDLGPAETTTEAVWRSQFGANYFSAVSANDGNPHGYLRNVPPQESVDFAKQLLVLVGTLVTWIASFYFGSKAATPSVNVATESPRPIIESIDQLEYLRGSGSKDVTLAGANLEGISGVMFRLNGKNVTATISGKSTNRLVFKLMFPKRRHPASGNSFSWIRSWGSSVCGRALL